MYNIPLMTDQVDVAIATKTSGGLKALRDGSANHYAGSTGNAVGGTANAITLTTDSGSPAHTTYGDGHAITIRPGSTNTSGVTIALDGLVAKSILKREAGALVALVAGDIVLNIEAKLLFSNQSDAWILEPNPNVALLNAANTFDQNQTIKKDLAALILDATTGSPSLAMNINGVQSAVIASHGVDLINFRRMSDGASVFQFNTALQKMTQGTVPLARVGVAHTFTFTDIGNNSESVQDFAHGLGTDNIRVLISSNQASFSSSCRAKRPDGQNTSVQFGNPLLAPIMVSPASGSIRVGVRNEMGFTQTFVLKVIILRED